MPKKKVTKPKANQNIKSRKNDNSDILIGLLLLLLAIFIAISLLSYTPQANLKAPENWGGSLGWWTAGFLYKWLGIISYLLPILLILWGFNRLLRKPAKKLTLNTLTLIGFGFLLQITLGYFFIEKARVSEEFALYNVAGPTKDLISLGGKIGNDVFLKLTSLVGKIGLGFILSFLLLGAVVLIFNINLHEFLLKAIDKAREHRAQMTETALERKRQRIQEEQRLLQQQTQEKTALLTGQQKQPPKTLIKDNKDNSQHQMEKPSPASPPLSNVQQRILKPNIQEVSVKELHLAELLDPASEDLARPPDQEAKHGARLLESKLEEFGVHGSVGDIIPGPVITRYEYHPAPGIKISKITGLADDLSLSLKADRIRILPIPGKSAVGIEIPNKDRKTVGLRMIVRSPDFLSSKSPLTLALGTTITGAPQIADLAAIPHLLIAGTTGSGKSVCIHSLLTSMLLNSGPDEVRFMAIDPKRLELPAYNPIPHFIQPAIVDPRKAANCLELAVKIMEERYKEFSRIGVRDISGYNALSKKPKPYIVVIVDELADLMLTAPGEVEQRIIRLAQMARAVGIHLVLATQRPSVDVITGLIKANFPGRIAFQVASKTDSRTILDMNGAEALLGKGDMLFLPPGKGEPIRLHGSFVSAPEVQRIVEKLARSRLKSILYNIGQVDEEQALEYTQAIISADLLDPLLDPTETLYETKRQKLSEIIGASVLQAIEGQYYPPLDELKPIKERMEQKAELGDVDDFFPEAARLVMSHKEASVSMLQRRLNVGWARAGRIIDQLEQAGIVGPYEGSKSRKVTIQSDAELEKILKSIS